MQLPSGVLKDINLKDIYTQDIYLYKLKVECREMVEHLEATGQYGSGDCWQLRWCIVVPCGGATVQ